MAHVQTYYCHHSLGTKVKFNRVTNFKHVRDTWMNSSPQYNNLRSVASRERGNADLILMFSGYSGGGGDGWAGLAWVSSVCATKQNAYNMNLWTQDALVTAWVAAHETGHSLGMSHNPDKGCPNTGHWMGTGVGGSVQGNTWSACSKNGFQAHYNRYRSQWCMPEASNVCGVNGNSGCKNGGGSSGGGNWWNWWGKK